MAAPGKPHPPLHASRLGRALDTVVPVAAAVAWSVSLSTSAGTAPHSALLCAGAALTTIAVGRPWCRRNAQRTITAATWAAERERERASASAAEHSEHWRAIVDTANEGIVTIDSAGVVQTVNGAALRMFGYTERDLVGHNVAVLMPPPYSVEHDGYLARYLRTGERHIIGIGREVLGRRRDGNTFPIDLSVGEGEVDGRRFFTAVIRDVTERKELQTKLAQAERLAAVGELAAGVAHEVNNPINTMINCAQLIIDGDDPTQNAQIISEEGARIAEIVRDLLQFARDDRDRAQAMSLVDVVQRTLRLIGENWKRHGIQLLVDLPDDLPVVMARPQQVQQVLLNLLINAKDALLHSGAHDRRVWLSGMSDAGCVRIRVADTGPGIDPGVRDRIFDPFVTTKRARGGTGLGLSISKSIVEGYGGTIAVYSKPGEGATFEFTLPRAPAD